MTDAPTMSVRDLRNSLGNQVDRAHHTGQPTVIVKHSRPKAVLVSYDWWKQHADKPQPS